MENFIDWFMKLSFLGQFGVIFGVLFCFVVLWIVWVQLSDHFSSNSNDDEEPDFGDDDD